MISIDKLSKNINGNEVLKDITVMFEEGKVYGLCGANGSGKTMLLRAISGLIKPSSGSIKIGNKILHKDMSFPKNMGIIIENMELLPYMSAKDNLILLSKIKGIASEDDIETSLKRVGLITDIKVRKYSLGMRQKLNIAQAIFEKPDIILLDEPTNALDEESVELVHKIFRQEAKRGAVVIIATHNKYDLEDCCDVVMRMHNGELVVGH